MLLAKKGNQCGSWKYLPQAPLVYRASCASASSLTCIDVLSSR